MLIFFRSRGGGAYGWGNVIRLSIIALHFHKIGAKVIFFYEGSTKLNELLKKNPFQIIKLKNNIEISKEKKIFINAPSYSPPPKKTKIELTFSFIFIFFFENFIISSEKGKYL